MSELYVETHQEQERTYAGLPNFESEDMLFEVDGRVKDVLLFIVAVPGLFSPKSHFR